MYMYMHVILILVNTVYYVRASTTQVFSLLFENDIIITKDRQHAETKYYYHICINS